MTKLIEISLGKEAVEYVRARLKNGKSLARHISQMRDLNRGLVRTVLPDYVTRESARELRAGGKLWRNPLEFQYIQGKKYLTRIEPVPSLNEDLAKAILSSLPSHTWILEEGIGTASSPWIRKRDGNLIFYQDEVYEVLDSSSSKGEVAHALAILNRTYPPLLAFSLSIASPSQLWGIGGQMNRHAFDVVAEAIDSIVVGAYDGEAFIYWTPT
jgi:hypothetical protein